MPRREVEHCLRAFQTNVLANASLKNEAKSYRLLRSGKHEYIGIRKVERLAELSLLRLHLSWEDFLESTFLRYICGAESGSGFSPQLLLTRELNLPSAFGTLAGEADLSTGIGTTP
jgi:hypothetical protein